MASLAAIGSVLAASSCCLPILPLMMAAGVVGSSTFSRLPALSTVASILFIAYGFYQRRRAKKMPAWDKR